eukprot:6397396-Amphidinium_carterae.1
MKNYVPKQKKLTVTIVVEILRSIVGTSPSHQSSPFLIFFILAQPRTACPIIIQGTVLNPSNSSQPFVEPSLNLIVYPMRPIAIT